MENKLVLAGLIQDKEQEAIKILQFSSEFLIKQAQYRFLNPLSSEYGELSQRNRMADYMSQLNYLTSKQYTDKMKKLKLGTSNSPQNIKDEKKLISQNQQQQQDTKVIFKVEPKIEEQSQQSNSENYSSSISSKKRKIKVEKINSKSQKLSQTEITKQDRNNLAFRKRKIKPEQSESSQPNHSVDDSFENYVFADKSSCVPIQVPSQSSKTNLKQKITLSQSSISEQLNAQDFKSYHSSIIQKPQIIVELQNQTQNELSLSGNQQKQSYSSIRAPNCQNSGLSSDLTSKQLLNSADILSQPSINQEQIDNYLLKLQNFEVQQELRAKRVHKIWQKPFNSFSSLNKFSWHGLDLPKPSYKIKTFEYARIIQ